jgi:CsoR family transcriptional regulator, copper-sensing transcriptional repressor
MMDAKGNDAVRLEKAADSRSKAALVRRLRRVEGQVQGLQKMIVTARDPVEILMLVAQVRGALQSVAALVFEDYLVQSAAAVRTAEDQAKRDRLIALTVRMFKRWAT